MREKRRYRPLLLILKIFFVFAFLFLNILPLSQTASATIHFEEAVWKFRNCEWSIRHDMFHFGLFNTDILTNASTPWVPRPSLGRSGAFLLDLTGKTISKESRVTLWFDDGKVKLKQREIKSSSKIEGKSYIFVRYLGPPHVFGRDQIASIKKISIEVRKGDMVVYRSSFFPKRISPHGTRKPGIFTPFCYDEYERSAQARANDYLEIRSKKKPEIYDATALAQFVRSTRIQNSLVASQLNQYRSGLSHRVANGALFSNFSASIPAGQKPKRSSCERFDLKLSPKIVTKSAILFDGQVRRKGCVFASQYHEDCTRSILGTLMIKTRINSGISTIKTRVNSDVSVLLAPSPCLKDRKAGRSFDLEGALDETNIYLGSEFNRYENYLALVQLAAAMDGEYEGRFDGILNSDTRKAILSLNQKYDGRSSGKFDAITWSIIVRILKKNFELKEYEVHT